MASKRTVGPVEGGFGNTQLQKTEENFAPKVSPHLILMIGGGFDSH